MTRPEGLYRLRFVNGGFDALLEIPQGISLVEWRQRDRDEVRKERGTDAKVAYMTTKILRQWDDDSELVIRRRKTIPKWVYEHFGVSRRSDSR